MKVEALPVILNILRKKSSINSANDIACAGYPVLVEGSLTLTFSD
jgi:hypothetical protein